MKRIATFAVALTLIRGIGAAQGQPAGPDTSALPRLEIPEITIIGKKAITLPFARKGEIYDVDIYEAPPPDSSLLQSRPAVPLPVGSLPRYEEPLTPWHLSAEGALGTFSSAHGRGFFDYKSATWGIYGNGGFTTTQGHTNNSAGNSFQAEGVLHSLVSTDNELLKALRVAIGSQFMHESYGRFGHSVGALSGIGDRSGNNFVLSTQLSSAERESNALDANLSADIWSLSDTKSINNGDVSAVSPKLNVAFAAQAGDVRILTGASYQGSSLSYQSSGSPYRYPKQSPSLAGLSVGAQWKIQNGWYIHAGGRYDGGTDDYGESRSLAAPVADLRWELDRDREITFWFRPSMELASFSDRIRENPYLSREVDLRPERTPVNLGMTFWFNSGPLSIELEGSYRQSSNHAVTISGYLDTAGIPRPYTVEHRIQLVYVDADQFLVQARGTIRASDVGRITFSGIITPAVEVGTTTQLPMTPIIRLAGRGELDAGRWLTLWSSLEYWSSQNVDLAGVSTIPGRAVLSVGGFSRIIPQTMLALDITNLFNTAYQWWSGYVAPGRQLMLSARINFE